MRTDLHAGDAIFYNYTVHHGVAPIESGARVSESLLTEFIVPKYQSDDFLILHCNQTRLVVFNGILL